MNLFRTPLFFLIFIATAIFGVAFFYLETHKEKPPTIREHKNFLGIDISGSIDSEIIAGKDFSVELVGNENLLKDVTSEVSNGVLLIYAPKNPTYAGKMKVKISLPEIQKLVVSGSSNSDISNVETEKLYVTLNGRSTAKMNGNIKYLTLSANGESEFKAEKLVMENADCKLHGASKATISVSNDLDIEAFGASSLDYFGKPKRIRQNLTGASTINPID